jgi:hypothetical protein
MSDHTKTTAPPVALVPCTAPWWNMESAARNVAEAKLRAYLVLVVQRCMEMAFRDRLHALGVEKCYYARMAREAARRWADVTARRQAADTIAELTVAHECDGFTAESAAEFDDEFGDELAARANALPAGGEEGKP